MNKPKVLLLGKIEHAHESWQQLSQVAEIVKPHCSNRRNFLNEADAGRFEGVVAAYRTFDSVALTGRVDAELLSHLPTSLRFICHVGAGYDQIDVPACTARRVAVSNTPSAVDDATADMAIFLMLGALRNVNPGLLALRAGAWRGLTIPQLGHDPRGKVLGILGMGGIGRTLARKAALAFCMRIHYHNRTRLSEEVERECGGATYVDFAELLRGSDVLSLNLPLNPSTRHMISHDQFAQMKRGVIVINTARGAVMDEAALAEALDSGRVAGAGLDVYEDEPEVHEGLVANPRALLVPHMGTYTVETQARMEEFATANLRAAVEEDRLRSIVPEQRGLELFS